MLCTDAFLLCRKALLTRSTLAPLETQRKKSLPPIASLKIYFFTFFCSYFILFKIQNLRSSALRVDFLPYLKTTLKRI
jgi:hypothetical protein